MADTSTEDLSNKNLTKPLIRTMEDDLRLLKANLSPRTAASANSPSVVTPAVKPAAAPVPAPMPAAPKPAVIPVVRPDDALKKTPISLATTQQDSQAAVRKAQLDEKDRAKEKQKEEERLIQIEAEKALEKIRKKNEEFKREAEKFERIEKEKAEQVRIENEKIEKERIEKEKIEQERIKKEKERLVQIEAEKELERIRKKDEELRVEREKAEQIRLENERLEKAKKEKAKAERERVRKEKERLAQIEAEKEMERKIKRDEELRIERVKAEQVRKEKEIIEQAKREEAMKIRKKLSEEIKKEMEEEILKEREKAEQVKIQMELEIKKEIEAAEQVKKDREAAMRKRVAKVVKEEMDQEIEKEKEKAEQIKKEVEVEIKKEMEEDLEKEKELEKVIKEEMAIDMRKEISEHLKKDRESDNDKNIPGQPKEEIMSPVDAKPGDVAEMPKTNPASKLVVKIVDVPVNLPIIQTPVSGDQDVGKAQIDEETKKIKQLLGEEELEILKKKDEELKKEKEIAEQLKKEKENLEKIVREQEALQRERAQREKERLVQSEVKKEMEISKEPVAASAVNSKDKNIFAYKNAWQDSPLNSEFFAEGSEKASAPISAPAPAPVPKVAANPALASILVASPAAPPPPNLPKEPKIPGFRSAQSAFEKTVNSTEPDFKPTEPGLETNANPPLPRSKPSEPVLDQLVKPPVSFSPKKKLSSFPAERPLVPKIEPKKTAKKQYFELSGEYEHHSPEMRLAQQGFSSLSADLEDGVRKDSESMNQDIALKKKVAASNVLPVTPVSNQSRVMQVPAEGSLRREPAPVFKTILKIMALVLLVAGLFYGIYSLVFKKTPISSVPYTGQPVLAGMKQFDVSLDFNSNAMPAIKEYVKNNTASTENVSRIVIKDSAGGNTLKVSDFGKALGVIIPAKFLDNLMEDYDLVIFNYPKNNYLRMGMVLKVKDADLAVSLAKEWEPAMFIGTNSLLFDASGYYDNNKIFGTGTYKNSSIKYLSLGKSNLALNYTVDKNKGLFLFATSQEDIYYLIDRLTQ